MIINIIIMMITVLLLLLLIIMILILIIMIIIILIIMIPNTLQEELRKIHHFLEEILSIKTCAKAEDLP